jgi:hypothetical protein
VIADNTWGSSGGGVTLFGAGTPVVRDNVVRDNVAGDGSYGGGFWIENHSDARIVGNLVLRNIAGVGGGLYVGVVAGDRGAALLNNTVVGNEATGSALYITGFPEHMPVVNNILMTRHGDAVVCEELRGVAPPQLRHNDIQSRLGADSSGSCSGAVGSDGNVSRLPSFVDFAGDDFRLSAGSPLVDEGTTAGLGLPPVDRFGLPRIADGDGDGAARVDIGAHERQAPAAR